MIQLNAVIVFLQLLKELDMVGVTVKELKYTTVNSSTSIAGLGATYTFGGTFPLYREIFRQVDAGAGMGIGNNSSNTFRFDRRPGCPHSRDVPNMAVLAVNFPGAEPGEFSFVGPCLNKSVRTLIVAPDDYDCASSPFHPSTLRPAFDSELYIYCPKAAVVIEQYVLDDRMHFGRIANYNGTHWVREATGEMWDRRNNLEGRQFRCMVNSYRPYAVAHTDGVKDPDDPALVVVTKYEGPYADAVLTMGQNMNFSCNYVMRTDNIWGTLKENKTWSGMIGSLTRHEVDFIALGITISSDRIDYMDFLLPLGYERPALYIRNMNKKSAPFNTYIIPFSRSLWMALYLSSFAIAGFAVLQRIWSHRKTGFSALDTIRFSGSVFWTTTSVYFGRRIRRLPKFVVVRGFLLWGLLVGDIIFISYRASLTSILSVPFLQENFKTFEQFLDSDYGLITVTDSAYVELFRMADEASDPLNYRAWKEKLEPHQDTNLYPDFYVGVRALMERELVAYYDDDHAASDIVQRENLECKVVKVWTSNMRSMLSMVLPKGSEFTKLFTKAHLKLLEEGNFVREFKRIQGLVHDEDCNRIREPSQLYLGMNKIWTAFLVLALGILLCSIAHGIEWIAGGRRRDVFAEQIPMKDSMEQVKRHLDALERWIWHNQTEEGVIEELDDIQKQVVKIDRSIDVARMMNQVMEKQETITKTEWFKMGPLTGMGKAQLAAAAATRKRNDSTVKMVSSRD